MDSRDKLKERLAHCLWESFMEHGSGQWHAMAEDILAKFGEEVKPEPGQVREFTIRYWSN